MNNPLEQPGIIVLDAEPTDPSGKYPYKAILQRKHSDNEKTYERGFDGAWILKIIGIYPDGPSLTPGQWYLDTLLGYSDFGRKLTSDFIYIDAGQKWGVGNMNAVLKEAEEVAYGQLEESLNEGAVKDLILRGPGREPMIIWASQNAPFTIEELQQYAAENELSIRELKTLIEIYMEDATDEEIEILSDMEIVILETEREGGLNEEEEIRYSHGNYLPPDMKNWYQKPENKVGYKEPQPIQLKRLKKKTPKVFSKMMELEGEIQDLTREVKDLYRRSKEFEGEREEFLAWLSDEYGWNILDMMASGISDEEKIKGMEEWNLAQDRKDKQIENPKRLIDEYRAYYPEEDQDVDAEISKIEDQIKEKAKELSDMEDLYESINEGVSSRINFKRFEEEILKPLAEQMEVEFKIGRVSRVASIGKKIIERYYAIGHLTILVRDIKRLGMPGEDIEPWIVDPDKPTKGLRFGSDWGSYKEFKDKVRELLKPDYKKEYEKNFGSKKRQIGGLKHPGWGRKMK